MEEALLSFLLWLNKIEDIRDLPREAPSAWVGELRWNFPSQGQPHFTVASTDIVRECQSRPEAHVKFPAVLYGAQRILVDGKEFLQFGDPTMKSPNYVVGAPVVACTDLKNANSIEWSVTAYSVYYARIPFYPHLTATKPLTELFSKTLAIGAVVGLAVLALFALSVLRGKESPSLVWAMCSAIICMGAYQLSLVAPAFEIPLSMLNVNRLGDMCLVWGVFATIMCYRLEGFVPKKLFYAHTALTVLSLPFHMLGSTGDTVQFGTTLPMITVLLSFLVATFQMVAKFKKTPSAENALMLLFNVIFVGVVANDINVFTGAAHGYTFMSVGVLLSFLILIFAVNERITATYEERDYLRSNLEKEVARKTAELRATQAELVQSAKLASLGTLSAGIAHEINNSINFVNGAIQPLEKLIGKLEPVSQRDYEVGKKLLVAIKDGVGITVEIVKSLRQFTGLNQAKLKDVKIHEVARSVSTILHAKLKDSYRVELDIPEDLTLYGDVVGINQILMNLMTNAMDAMPKGGTIRISARENGEQVVIEVRDTGSGIPKEIVDKIFDPFFTTKEVGKGTGLGLYIVNKEMERYKGKVIVNSIPAHGTSFELYFPKTLKNDLQVAA